MPVFLGIIPVPRDDARLVDLGTDLARLGFVALFPWSEAMMDRCIAPEESDNMVRAFTHLRNLGSVDPNRVGMSGFCVGASMLTIAASDPRINDQVAFVSAFGGYFNMADMLIQACRHTSFYGDAEDPWDANHLIGDVMAHQMVEGLGAEHDRIVLTKMFLEGDPEPGDGPPAGLSTDGTQVYYLLRSMLTSQVGHRLGVEDASGLIENFTSEYRTVIGKISPITTIANVKAQMLIAPDQEDNPVPVEESRRLAEALTSRGNFFFTEFSLFTHVTPDKSVRKLIFVKEASKLFRYTYSIVRLVE